MRRGVMKNSYMKNWVLAVIALIFPLLAQAQGSARKIEFTCIAWNGVPAETLFYWDGKKHQPIELKKYKRTDTYVTQGERFNLFLEQMGDDGEKVYQVIASAPFASDTKKMLYVLKHGQSNGKFALQIMGMNDAQSVFPRGGFRFVNFTKDKKLVLFEGKKLSIAPGASKIVKASGPEQGGFMPFLIGNHKGEKVFETQIYRQPAGRKMVFIGPSRNGRKMPTVKYFTDIVRANVDGQAASQ